MHNPPPPPGAGFMSVPANLASPWLRIVGGLIDAVILAIVFGIVDRATRGDHGLAGLTGLILTVAYFGYMLSAHGQSLGMMVFGFQVRDIVTGRRPTFVRSAVRGLMWWLELVLTPCCLLGFVGWGWQLWDRQNQAFHDKAAGTIVTTA